MGRRKKTESGAETVPVSKVYFTQGTEDAIVQYNNSVDLVEREAIFRQHIAYPLDKLSENVINRFQFPYIRQSFDDTKRDVVAYLVTNLHKYDQSKGHKAFSYFSVIAKNYLILHNTIGYKEEKRNVYLSESGEEYISLSLDDVATTLEAPDVHVNDDMREFVALMIDYWDRNLSRIFKKKRDVVIAEAVVQLFRDADNLENFHKKALYLMIREMTDCKTNYITKVVNKMRDHTARQLQEYFAEGTIDGEDSDLFRHE